MRGGGRGRARAAARRHHPQHADPALAQAAVESLDVARDPGTEVRLNGGRAGALELTKQGEHLVARRDAHARERVAQGGSEQPLVRRVAKREQQRDGDGFRRERPHRDDHARHFPLGERLEHLGGAHALRDPHHVSPRDEWRRVVTRQVVERGTVLASQPQEVFESAGRDEHDAGAAPLEQRVGRDGCTVDQHVYGDGGRGKRDGWGCRRTRPPSLVPRPQRI